MMIITIESSIRVKPQSTVAVRKIYCKPVKKELDIPAMLRTGSEIAELCQLTFETIEQVRFSAFDKALQVFPDCLLLVSADFATSIERLENAQNRRSSSQDYSF